ncbi:hypothetical protein SBOR_8738 [Sclerotinia borealis F-4128]|uniref:Uncharacterized protein n=1 Tax=Sclerotinia borealis (strain F-4128) TaxID=1432307 RepID=W9C7M7_SCLBF|nr:hypothetical protein SBOR_8738 [Sclerotinia borealis F-4128]
MSGNMTKEDASRIQSTQQWQRKLMELLQQAKGEKDMSSSGFAARAQSAGDRTSTAGATTAAQGTGSAGNTTSGNAGQADANKK